MLVLSRKRNDRIQVGGDIVVTVVRIRGGVVRIGIEAPDDVSIRRAEVVPRVRPSPSGVTDGGVGLPSRAMRRAAGDGPRVTETC